jgi:hypothetical protein
MFPPVPGVRPRQKTSHRYSHEPRNLEKKTETDQQTDARRCTGGRARLQLCAPLAACRRHARGTRTGPRLCTRHLFRFLRHGGDWRASGPGRGPAGAWGGDDKDERAEIGTVESGPSGPPGRPTEHANSALTLGVLRSCSWAPRVDVGRPARKVSGRRQAKFARPVLRTAVGGDPASQDGPDAAARTWHHGLLGIQHLRRLARAAPSQATMAPSGVTP